MKTFVTTPTDIDQKWYLIDAADKVLGRLAAEVATLLRGKGKPIYQPNIDAGDYVVIINAEKVILSGMKEDQKNYFSASQYVGNSKEIPFKDVKEKHPERIIEKAVKGMLPHNPLGRKMGKKLYVYTGTEHKHQAQKPEIIEL
ncbi:50S ribosomal protein L13 [Candidatus Latescibacterota bacterium]